VLIRLRAIPGLQVFENVALAACTRFGIGGPARLLLDASTESALAAALAVLRETGALHTIIGGGSNLIANDDGFPGAVVRYTNALIENTGPDLTELEATGPEAKRRGGERVRLRAAAGAVLQDLVDRTVSLGLRGLETLTGIPGWVGGAIYGNAGAYGHSIEERIRAVRFLDSAEPGAPVRTLDKPACEFRYRESVFKKNKQWIILSAELELDRANAEQLRETAAGIRKIRDEKYPPSMRCAGSIFKNLFFAELTDAARAEVPAQAIREGKVPSAYFLERVGAKGMTLGGVRVADYHANLLYNTGGGTAGELRELIGELERRVRERFGIQLEQEVQQI
jgi:UDP-N-acetylmuramate dehydrogenase